MTVHRFRGISSLVAFSALLALSVALSVYIYSVAVGSLEVSKPVPSFSVDIICYNVSGFTVSVPSDTVCLNLCRDSLMCYMCRLNVDVDFDAKLVLEDRVVSIHIDRNECIVLLDSRPVQFYGYRDSFRVDGRVKIYDPWTK